MKTYILMGEFLLIPLDFEMYRSQLYTFQERGSLRAGSNCMTPERSPVDIDIWGVLQWSTLVPGWWVEAHWLANPVHVHRASNQLSSTSFLNIKSKKQNTEVSENWRVILTSWKLKIAQKIFKLKKKILSKNRREKKKPHREKFSLFHY